jgi:hypothetical protein
MLLILPFILNAEDFFSTNNSYTQSRIKSLAKKNVKHGKTCYIYVDINGNRDWRRYYNRLNTRIKNDTNCKKFIIYKIIQNVNTYRRYGNSNNNNGTYKINLGAIVEENANVDITIHTVVKNSTLKEGVFSGQKVNTGIVIEGNNEVNNKDYKSYTNIKNSKIGKQNMLEEYGLEVVKDYLNNDKDNPLN